MPSNRLFAFYGHHKCATMWINRIIATVCGKLALHFDAVYGPDDFDGDLAAYIATRDVDFISLGNAQLDHVRNLREHLGFHIIRDPRDITVSAYFSHLHSHSTSKWSELVEYREKLQSVPQDEGLMLEIENRSGEFRDLSTWDYNQENILEVRFEDLVLHSYDNLLRIFGHLQLLDERDYRIPGRARTLALELIDYLTRNRASALCRAIKPDALSGAEVLIIAWRNRFQARAAGRKVGEENRLSHFRKGQPGDWRNHFKPEHKRLFKELYPNLLTELGYENADDW